MNPTEAPPGRLDRLHRLRDPTLAVTSTGSAVAVGVMSGVLIPAILDMGRDIPDFVHLLTFGGVGIGLCVLVAIAPVVFNVL